MTSRAEQQRIASYIDSSVWMSYVRILASQRFRLLADNGVLIPPDIAQVSNALLGYQKRAYGNLVNGFLLPSDAELTAMYQRSRPRDAAPLPAGQTFLTPFAEHRDALEAADVIQDSWVWHDMPAELYIINQPDLDPAVRRVLLDLGYGEAAARKAAGQPVFVPDPEAVAKAAAMRASSAPKLWLAVVDGFAAVMMRAVLPLVGITVGGALVAWGIYRVVNAAMYRWEHKEEWKINADKARTDLQASQVQLGQIDLGRQQLAQCNAAAAAGQRPQAECDAIATEMLRMKPVTSAPPGVPPFASCGFGNCWPWALLGLGIGAVGGGLVAKKRGWV